MKKTMTLLVFLGLGLLAWQAVHAADEPGFQPLFDGKSLAGWKYVGKKEGSYTVKDGLLCCVRGGQGTLYTEKTFADFVLRFEFRLEDGSNNGIGIRAPMEGDAAYFGMEIQILEEGAALRGKWGQLRPAQFHGSVYDVFPAKRGALKPPGQWNRQEISAIGRRIRVTLNDQVILDEDINSVTDPAVLARHPGLLRDRGHIALLGHDDYVEFRNIRVRELPEVAKDNVPPEGFTLLFNGRNLDGWKGLLAPPNDNPVRRAKLAAEQLAAEQAKADEDMRTHWSVQDGVLVFDGKGRSLCTARDYGDFELLVDWKITAGGDSGIYLRGSPQVQIWDNPIGSGGLYNNQKNPSRPAKVADNPVGQWNRFRILMQGEKVTVFLNNELVVHSVTMENYWDRSQPIFPAGQIELQSHGSMLWFKNIYIRELARR